MNEAEDSLITVQRSIELVISDGLTVEALNGLLLSLDLIQRKIEQEAVNAA